MDPAARDPGRQQRRRERSRRRAATRGRLSLRTALLSLPTSMVLGGFLLATPMIPAADAAAATAPAASPSAAPAGPPRRAGQAAPLARPAPAPAHRAPRSRRLGTARHSRALPPPVIHLMVTDPNYSGGLQVDDTLTVTAHVTRGRVRPGGTVSFTTDERYDRGCRPEKLGRSATVVCYITFYIPGPHRITARFVALDHRVAVVSIPLHLLSTTNS